MVYVLVEGPAHFFYISFDVWQLTNKRINR